MNRGHSFFLDRIFVSVNIFVAKSEIQCYSEFGIVTAKAKPKTWSRVLGFAFLYVKDPAGRCKEP